MNSSQTAIPTERDTPDEALGALQQDLEGRVEELVNWLSAGVGFLASICGLVVLLVMAVGNASPLMTGAVLIYGVSLVTLHCASTLYHISKTPRMRRAMKIFDHAAIFGLIAGSWTPFLLGPLQETQLGWTLFGVIWGLALIGIALKLFFVGRFRLLSTGVYLGMGWLALAIMGPLANTISEQAFFWLLAGGGAYTVGVVFYLWQRLPFNHGIWHGFVMAGGAAHFVAIVNLLP